MLTIFSEKHALHAPTGELVGGAFQTPFESPQRAQAVAESVLAYELGGQGFGGQGGQQGTQGTKQGAQQSRRLCTPDELREPDDFGDAPILAIHDADYVEFLRSIWQAWHAAGKSNSVLPTVWPSRSMPGRTVPPAHDLEGRVGYYALSAETAIVEGTWQAAYWSAQTALTATAAVRSGTSVAFGLCRPPGHHASHNQYGGYCFLNNAAIAAQDFIAAGAERVAVLDVDFHHGNGTQEIFYNRSDVYYISLHGDPEHTFPNFLGYADERGAEAGEGYTLNFPYPPGTGWNLWQEGLNQACRVCTDSGAEALVVSLGVDTFHNDPLSFFRLTQEDYLEAGRMIAQLALPTVFLLEGGYDLDNIGGNVCSYLEGFTEVRGG